MEITPSYLFKMLPHVQSISLLNYWVALSYSKHLSHKWNSTSFENQQLEFHSLNLSHPTFLDTHESKYICTKDHQVMFPWHKQESVNSIGNGSQHRANGKKVHSATKVREKSLSVNLCNVASDQICLCHFSHQYNMEYPEGEATF